MKYEYFILVVLFGFTAAQNGQLKECIQNVLTQSNGLEKCIDDDTVLSGLKLNLTNLITEVVDIGKQFNSGKSNCTDLSCHIGLIVNLFPTAIKAYYDVIAFHGEIGTVKISDTARQCFMNVFSTIQEQLINCFKVRQ